MENFEHTPLPERAANLIKGFLPPEEKINQRIAQFSNVRPRPEDEDGDTETIEGTVFTHHFVHAPGDYDTIRWHYVESGPQDAEIIVFLHGIPDSWFGWHKVMAALSKTHRCVAVDLKGYGQSEKRAGDYRHEGAAEQMWTMLQQIGVKKFNIVCHDRGTVQADFIAANHPDSVLRYGRGEQHLYHFNPLVAPQEELFRNAPWSGMMEDPVRFVVWAYMWVADLPIADDVIARIAQEFSYPDVNRATSRYFNSSTFHQEWVTRRRRLLKAWKCPVLILQGYDSKSQPREFYENARDYIPNASRVEVRYLPGGHFWAVECPTETIAAIQHMLTM